MPSKQAVFTLLLLFTIGQNSENSSLQQWTFVGAILNRVKFSNEAKLIFMIPICFKYYTFIETSSALKCLN